MTDRAMYLGSDTGVRVYVLTFDPQDQGGDGALITQGTEGFAHDIKHRADTGETDGCFTHAYTPINGELVEVHLVHVKSSVNEDCTLTREYQVVTGFGNEDGEAPTVIDHFHVTVY